MRFLATPRQVFALGPLAYLRNGWNVLDGAATALSVLALFDLGPSWAKSLRMSRALRPLRLASRLPWKRPKVTMSPAAP